MNKRLLVFITVLFILGIYPSRGDEGMWMINLLNKMDYGKLTEMGLELSPEDIYSVNHSSLKDAVVVFGGGCTGEIISDKGLLLTNMHCGYDQIQSHSTMENDYLKKGFWAKSMDEELPNPGLKVKFLKRIEDVTEQINLRLSGGMSEGERKAVIRQISDRLENNAVKNTHYSASVESFYEGNQFYLFVYETFRDVRLVASPPTSIGDFGSLTDNWMWPRHKADFSIFRVYMSPEGKPADYSPENIPYQPGHHLPISLKGVEEDDFTMIMGYPGSTDRHMTSSGIQELKQIEHPNRINIRGKKLDILKKTMEKKPELRLMYSSKYKSASNYWKYSIGQMEGFKRIDLMSERKKIEKAFEQWSANNRRSMGKYEDALDLIEVAYKKRAPYKNASQYLLETMLMGPEITLFVNKAYPLRKVLKQPFIKRLFKGKKIEQAVEKLREQADRHFRDYHRATDQAVAEAMLSMYRENIDTSFYPGAFTAGLKKYGDVKEYVSHIYNNSLFTDQERFSNFIENPQLDNLENDPGYRFTMSVFEKYRDLSARANKYNDQLQKGRRLFVDGLMKMHPDKTFYPDANSTMRLTYGTVGGYQVRDAVRYQYYTTLEGVMEKEDPDNYEFIVPGKLKKLYQEKNYGRYGNNGQMPVCFITNNDITGGNSGSPVMNGKGELIGLAFDSNWEGMTGDIEFEEGMQKTVCTDIRYLLFILDKFGEVDWLIEEMDIVN
jgi:hypothetical protein